MFEVPPLPSGLKRRKKDARVGVDGKPIYLGPSDLLPGDILLSLGTARHSDWIQFLDGGAYSHASYFNGEKLIELSVNGVQETPTAVRVDTQVYMDVYRFFGDDGEPLTAEQAGAVTEAMGAYLGHPLATHDLVLCSLLVVSRRLNLPGTLEDPIRKILSLGVRALRKLIFRDEKEHLICSELICRGFWEASDPGPFELRIFPQFPEDLYRVPQVLGESPKDGSPFSSPLQPETRELMQEFASLYVAHRLGCQFPMKARHFGDSTDTSAESMDAVLVNRPVADYVTPRDLERSKSLKEQGRACKEYFGIPGTASEAAKP